MFYAYDKTISAIICDESLLFQFNPDEDVIEQYEMRGAKLVCHEYYELAKKVWIRVLYLRKSPSRRTNSWGMSSFTTSEELDLMNECQLLEQCILILEFYKQEDSYAIYLKLAEKNLNQGNIDRAFDLFLYIVPQVLDPNFELLLFCYIDSFIEAVENREDQRERLMQCFLDNYEKNETILIRTIVMMKYIPTDKLRSLVKKNPVFSQTGDSMLHKAALFNNISAVTRLLECGADVNAMNYDDSTPLHMVRRNRHLATILLEYGAHADLVDRYGRRPSNLLEDFRPNLQCLAARAVKENEEDIPHLLKKFVRLHHVRE